MRRGGARYKVTSPFGVDDASARVGRLVDESRLAGSGAGRPDGHDRVVDRIDLSRVGARPGGLGGAGADVGDPAGDRTHHLAGSDRRLPGPRGGAALHRRGAPPRRGRLRDRLPRHRPGELALRMGSSGVARADHLRRRRARQPARTPPRVCVLRSRFAVRRPTAHGHRRGQRDRDRVPAPRSHAGGRAVGAEEALPQLSRESDRGLPGLERCRGDRLEARRGSDAAKEDLGHRGGGLPAIRCTICRMRRISRQGQTKPTFFSSFSP